MKLPIVFQLSAFFVYVLIVTGCKPPEVDTEVIVSRTDTLSIAKVRSYSDHSIPTRIVITDAHQEGVYVLDANDHSSADNTGTILVTANGKRYKREFSGPASAAWFGVDPSDADIGLELQVAVNAVNTVFIPDGSYTQLTTVRLRSGMTLQSNPGKVFITLPQSYVSLANAIDPSIPLKDVVIDGLSWNITSRQNGVFGTIYIDSPSVTNLTVQNCSSTDAAAKDSTNWFTLKIPAGKTAENIVVKNNSVQAKRMGCEIFNHDNYGIYAGKTIEVSNNYFHDCFFGISLSGPLDGLTVDNNLVKNCGHFGIEIAGAAHNVKITNNKFEGVFDKFLEGSNDGNGNGTIVGGMVVTGNSTVGRVTGGIQIFNGGAIAFSKNTFNMSGMLELAHSTKGGMFTDNTIESAFNKAIICDNSPNNTFSNNTISNRSSNENQATFISYGEKATNNTLTNNKLFKGQGGKYYDAVLGGSTKASMNYDEQGNPIP